MFPVIHFVDLIEQENKWRNKSLWDKDVFHHDR